MPSVSKPKCDVSCCMRWSQERYCKHRRFTRDCYLTWLRFEYCPHRVLKCQDCKVVCLIDADCTCTTPIKEKQKQAAEG